MHAFMALFFYELIRDQIVLYDTRGPWLWPTGRRSWLQDHAFSTSGDRGAKKKEKLKYRGSRRVQVMSKTDFKRLFIHLCLCIYLFVPFDSRSELYGRSPPVCLKCYFLLSL